MTFLLSFLSACRRLTGARVPGLAFSTCLAMVPTAADAVVLKGTLVTTLASSRDDTGLFGLAGQDTYVGMPVQIMWTIDTSVAPLGNTDVLGWMNTTAYEASSGDPRLVSDVVVTLNGVEYVAETGSWPTFSHSILVADDSESDADTILVITEERTADLSTGNAGVLFAVTVRSTDGTEQMISSQALVEATVAPTTLNLGYFGFTLWEFDCTGDTGCETVARTDLESERDGPVALFSIDAPTEPDARAVPAVPAGVLAGVAILLLVIARRF